jgi:polar amino acid transport system substrate-binding protein
MTRVRLISRRRFLYGSLAGGLAIAGSAPLVPGFAATEGTLERAKKDGYVTVGFANEVPFGYADENGNLTGEAPEILRVVVKKIGIPEIEGILTEFGSLIPGLKAGRFDIVSAGMYVTPARCQEILFSEPTYSLAEQLAVKAGNPKKIATYTEVAADPSIRLAIETGSASIKKALKAGVKDSQIDKFPDVPTAVAALRADRVDAVVGTALTFSDIIAKGGSSGLEALPPFTSVNGESVVGHGAFGFRKADLALRDAVNAQLKSFIGSPEHLALVGKFGFNKYTLPVLTTEEMCTAR